MILNDSPFICKIKQKCGEKFEMKIQQYSSLGKCKEQKTEINTLIHTYKCKIIKLNTTNAKHKLLYLFGRHLIAYEFI